jgi:hypothetical protein
MQLNVFHKHQSKLIDYPTVDQKHVPFTPKTIQVQKNKNRGPVAKPKGHMDNFNIRGSYKNNQGKEVFCVKNF